VIVSWSGLRGAVSLAAALAIPLSTDAGAPFPGRELIIFLAFAVILYLSVLLHEASHAFMARHYGFQVTSITLHFLGGATAIDGEAPTPRPEPLNPVVGPPTPIPCVAARPRG